MANLDTINVGGTNYDICDKTARDSVSRTLWKNNSPNSTFASQTITLSHTPTGYARLRYILTSDSGLVMPSIDFKLGESGLMTGSCGQSSVGSGVLLLLERGFQSTTSGTVHFDAPVSSSAGGSWSSAGAKFIIPYDIVG